MRDDSRAAEQARVAARSVLANLESLVAGGLAGANREQVVGLATRLSGWGARGPHLEGPATRSTIEQLVALLRPVRGLTARTVVWWLDEALVADARHDPYQGDHHVCCLERSGDSEPSS
ncbi:hypothetical protein LQ327_23135 [Actinomycetospora endophytica]|uniref:Uncharacterized protein n=1 Tax=Actinomycetospora endophytica TaxID=2291215 RepID=A0ABS8PDB8_9PSEU|nr:hypothetical protein [Actinomycetospora endophytica]MCD2196274.1 hypothetical protein [Actinomycetospora endophytica]